MMDLNEAVARDMKAHALAAAWRAALRQAVRDAVDGGMSESEAARRAGVTRMTIRAWRRGE